MKELRVGKPPRPRVSEVSQDEPFCSTSCSGSSASATRPQKRRFDVGRTLVFEALKRTLSPQLEWRHRLFTPLGATGQKAGV